MSRKAKGAPQDFQLPEGPLTVLGLAIDSFQGIRVARLTPPPVGLVPVEGPNGTGKSSLILSMTAPFVGKDEALDPLLKMPITIGEHGTTVTIDLGELVVDQTWTRDSGGEAKGRLVIRGADGRPFTSPRAVLDALVGHFADPVAFLRMEPKEQVRTVLAVMGLDEPLRALEAEAKTWYDERRDRGRELDRVSKAVAEIEQEIEGLPAPEVEGTLAELVEDLAGANEHNQRLFNAAVKREQIEREGKACSERIAELRATIEEAEREIERQTTVKASLTDRWRELTEQLREEEIDTEPIGEAIRAHEAAAEYQARLKIVEEKRAERDSAQERHAEAERALEVKRAEMRELLGSVAFPVPGMAYDQERDWITIDGVPLSQAPQSVQTRVAAAVVMAVPPPVRVLFVRDGALLDEDNRAVLDEEARARGFQIWCEIVTKRPEGAGIWIEEGQIYERQEDGSALAVGETVARPSGR